MTRPPDEVLSSHEALRELPADELASALIVALIGNEKDLAVTVLTLIEVARRMSKFLPEANIRTAVSWHLAEAAAELGVRWN